MGSSLRKVGLDSINAADNGEGQANNGNEDPQPAHAGASGGVGELRKATQTGLAEAPPHRVGALRSYSTAVCVRGRESERKQRASDKTDLLSSHNKRTGAQAWLKPIDYAATVGRMVAH